MDQQTTSPIISEHRINKIRDVVAHRQKGLAIILEDVHDPHNAAAIMRTADSLGITDIRLVFIKEAPYDPRLIGKVSSSSANKWMDFHIYTSIDNCYTDLRNEGFHIIVTTLTPESKKLEESDLIVAPLAIVFGNEHAGVSTEAVTGANASLYIPMVGMVQSLNVSVSAAIVMTEVVRRRKETGRDYTYSAQEQIEFVDDYLLR
jgi:tRNA (guanosine-2'-O-)-methyltransferase